MLPTSRVLSQDPAAEVADTRVDRRGARRTARRTPRRRSSQFTAADERTTGVTAAGARAGSRQTDVSVVDLGRTPGASTSRVGHDGHCRLLENRRQSAACGGQAPSADDAARSGVCAIRRRGQSDCVEVRVGRLGRESQHGNIVRVTAERRFRIVGVSGVGAETEQSACGARRSCTIGRSTENRVNSNGTSETVGGGDGTGGTDQRGATRVRGANTQRQLVRVVSNV